MADNLSLDDVRQDIDRLDEEIQKLIAERASLALKVAEAKRAAGETGDFYRPEREAQVLRSVKSRDCGPMEDKAMARIFREVMSACLAIQQPLKIAFFGPEGTFTQAAAFKQFGLANVHVPIATIDYVFREVESGAANYGVVPVENTTGGIVSHTLDRFLRSPLHIVGEVELDIHHCICSMAESLDNVKVVYSHEQSFAQCHAWLETHMPNVERRIVSSNGEAARLAGKESNAAAIGGRINADLYGLKLLAENIEDEPNNTTRFITIGSQQPSPTGKDKTSFVVSDKNRPGGLHALLQPLVDHGVSMSRIESRPSRRGLWEYAFFIDIEGHKDDANVSKALAIMEERSSLFKLLGSFPKAEL